MEFILTSKHNQEENSYLSVFITTALTAVPLVCAFKNLSFVEKHNLDWQPSTPQTYFRKITNTDIKQKQLKKNYFFYLTVKKRTIC